jgi:hypothetical protein
MRGAKPAADLHAPLDTLADGQRSLLQPLAERLALDQLEDDVRKSVLGAEVVVGEDVRVVESGHRSGLLLEAAKTVGIARAVRGQDVERDVAAQPRVARAVDPAHSPAPRDDTTS